MRQLEPRPRVSPAMLRAVILVVVIELAVAAIVVLIAWDATV